MVTPKREEIQKLALELWQKDQYRNGCSELAQNTPEYSELSENGYVLLAQNTLMRNSDSYRDYLLRELGQNPKDVIKEAKPFEIDIEEALKSGVYICGTTGQGKSDSGMYIADRLMEKGVIVIVFDSTQDWQTRSSIPKYQSFEIPYIDNIPIESMIYDISRLSVLQRQKLVERFCEMLYHYQVEQPDRKQYFLIFEEAHNYFKEGFIKAKRFSNSAMLLSEGRNYKVRFMCITQFSALIDKTAMRYMKQRYFGFSDEKNDLTYLTNFIGTENIEELKRFDAGEFFYYHTGKIDKIAINPYENRTSKVQIKPNATEDIQEFQPIEKRTNTDSMQAIASIVILLIWLWILAMALGSMYHEG